MSVFRIDQLHSDLPYRSFGSWIATESNISIREVQVINSHNVITFYFKDQRLVIIFVITVYNSSFLVFLVFCTKF